MRFYWNTNVYGWRMWGWAWGGGTRFIGFSSAPTESAIGPFENADDLIAALRGVPFGWVAETPVGGHWFFSKGPERPTNRGPGSVKNERPVFLHVPNEAPYECCNCHGPVMRSMACGECWEGLISGLTGDTGRG